MISDAFSDLRLTVSTCGWRCAVWLAIVVAVLVSAYFVAPTPPGAGLCRVYN